MVHEEAPSGHTFSHSLTGALQSVVPLKMDTIKLGQPTCNIRLTVNRLDDTLVRTVVRVFCYSRERVRGLVFITVLTLRIHKQFDSIEIGR